MWELERHEWTGLRSSDSATDVPEAIVQLMTAADRDQADRAYWRIDNEVIVQGALYEAARPTVTSLLAALIHCTNAARPKVLELLFQIGNGEPHPSEIAAGNRDLGVACRHEVTRGAVLFFDAVENVESRDMDLCVDLLILCADHELSLRPRVEWYLRRILGQTVHEGLKESIANWLGK